MNPLEPVELGVCGFRGWDQDLGFRVPLCKLYELLIPTGYFRVLGVRFLGFGFRVLD